MSRDDEAQFANELRDSLGYAEDVSPDLLGMIMTGYDIVNIDAVVADLVYDSLASGDLIPVRGEESVRVFTAEGGGVTFEFEVSGDPSSLSGRVIPIATGTVYLDQPGNAQSMDLLEADGFEFVVNPHSPFRLRLVPESGEVIATAWITHPAE